MNAITTIVIPAVLLVGLAVVLLGVKVLFVRGARFPSPHVHDHQALQEKGIRCAGHSGGPTASSQKNKQQTP